MKQSFFWKIVICVLPVVVAAAVVAVAFRKYEQDQGGFKLGVDLAGGTILVYEVDESKKLPDNYKPEELAASLKRRIDPTDLYNITIRPVGDKRVEIILPTSGASASGQRKEFTSEDVQNTKRLIDQVGSLEFRILANKTDDEEGMTEA